MSKIDKMYIRWKTTDKARNLNLGKRAMVGVRRDAEPSRSGGGVVLRAMRNFREAFDG